MEEYTPDMGFVTVVTQGRGGQNVHTTWKGDLTWWCARDLAVNRLFALLMKESDIALVTGNSLDPTAYRVTVVYTALGRAPISVSAVGTDEMVAAALSARAAVTAVDIRDYLDYLRAG